MSPPEALTSFLQKKPLVLVTLGEKYRDPIEAKGELRDHSVFFTEESLTGMAFCLINGFAAVSGASRRSGSPT